MKVNVNTIAGSAVYDKLGYRNVKVLQEEDLKDKSKAFGTPVFMPITFKRVSYMDYMNNKRIITPDIYIAACIVVINFQKDVVKTSVQGQHSPGTFKEFINQGDYSISIDGLINDDNNLYPIKNVKWINSIGVAPVKVEVEHKLLNELGIWDIVIESGGYTPKQGIEDQQAFKFECVSDYDRNLILLSEAEARKVW